MTITVKIGEKLFRLAGFRGPDGLAVHHPGGVKASKKLWEQIKSAAEERTKPKPYSPFQPFRTVGYVAR